MGKHAPIMSAGVWSWPKRKLFKIFYGASSDAFPHYRARVTQAIAIAVAAKRACRPALAITAVRHALHLHYMRSQSVKKDGPGEALPPVVFTALLAAALSCLEANGRVPAVLRAVAAERETRPWALNLELAVLLSPAMVGAPGLDTMAVRASRARVPVTSLVVAAISCAAQAVSLPSDMLAEELERGSACASEGGEGDGFAGVVEQGVLSVYGDLSIEASAAALRGTPDEQGVHVQAGDASSASAQPSLQDLASAFLSGPRASLPSPAALERLPPLYARQAGQVESFVAVFDNIVLEPRDDCDLDLALEVRARSQMRGAWAVDSSTLEGEAAARNPYAHLSNPLELDLLRAWVELPDSPLRHIFCGEIERDATCVVLNGLRLGRVVVPPNASTAGQDGALVMVHRVLTWAAATSGRMANDGRDMSQFEEYDAQGRPLAVPVAASAYGAGQQYQQGPQVQGQWQPSQQGQQSPAYPGGAPVPSASYAYGGPQQGGGYAYPTVALPQGGAQGGCAYPAMPQGGRPSAGYAGSRSGALQSLADEGAALDCDTPTGPVGKGIARS